MPRFGDRYWKLLAAGTVSNLGDGVALVAYPWLASAVTRNPVLVAGVLVVQRLPWLLLSLPAGVLADRHDRRRILVAMDLARFVVTGLVAASVWAGRHRLPSPEAVGSGAIDPGPGVFLVLVYGAAFLLGCAEVFRDSTSQVLLPALVPITSLERANGALWSAERVSNQLVGPVLGGLLLAGGFALPFLFDAGTFLVAAALVASITGRYRVDRERRGRDRLWAEVAEGCRWLRGHSLLWPMAVTLGMINALLALTMATFVFFVQEVLGLDAAAFGWLLTGGAVGGIVGSLVAPSVSRRVAGGPLLAGIIMGSCLAIAAIGALPRWGVVYAMFISFTALGQVWNVVTVSLRQAVVPDVLLGRVNSVYRFFGWGAISLGSLAGGLLVSAGESMVSREMALRFPFVVAAAGFLMLYAYARPRLTTARMEATRASVRARREAPV